VRTAFRNKNTLENIFRSKNRKEKFDNSGIYKLKCRTCQGVYIGQTGSNFKARYTEHIREIRNNKPKTGYAQHILDTGHEYGKLEDTMEIIEVQYKQSHLNTIKNSTYAMKK
jgi:hypothetical protein